MKLLISILKGLFWLFGFMIIAVLVVLYMAQYADWNKYRTSIQDSFYQSTGNKLEIKGDIKGQVLPYPAAQLQDAAITAKINDTEYKTSAKSLKMVIDLTDLLMGKIKFNEVKMTDVDIVDQSVQQSVAKFSVVETEIKLSQDTVHFNNLVVQHSSGLYKGDLNFIFYGRYNHLSGEIIADRITLPASKSAHTNHVLPMIELPLSGLSNYRGKVILKVGDLSMGDFNIKKAHLVFEPNRDQFALFAKGELFEGTLNADMTATGVDKPKETQLNLSIKAEDMNAAEFVNYFNHDIKLQGGRAEFDFKGHSNPQLLKQLSGKGQFSIHKLKLVNTETKSLHLSNIVFGRLMQNKQDEVECFIAKYNIHNGKVDFNQKIAVETKDIMGLGTATLDLNTERVDLKMQLQPRGKSPITLNEIDAQVMVTGTLAHPEVKTAANVAKSAGSAILGVVTGGVSLLAESAIEMLKPEESPCEKVKKSP